MYILVQTFCESHHHLRIKGFDFLLVYRIFLRRSKSAYGEQASNRTLSFTNDLTNYNKLYHVSYVPYELLSIRGRIFFFLFTYI